MARDSGPLMSVPIIVSVGEDALTAVPDSYREAAVSLGATSGKSCAACCSAAKNGLLAAVLLGVGRAIGETMAVLMAPATPVQIPASRSIRSARSRPPSQPIGRERLRRSALPRAVRHRPGAVRRDVLREPDADLIVKGIRGDSPIELSAPGPLAVRRTRWSTGDRSSNRLPKRCCCS